MAVHGIFWANRSIDKIMTEALHTPPSLWVRRRADLLAIGLVFVAYVTTLMIGLKAGFTGALAGGAANTVPVVIFGLVARRIMIKRLVGRRFAVQALGHVVLGAAFSVLSYWLLVVLLGLVNGKSLLDFSVRSFSTEGTAWQMLEEATTYAVLAALTYAQLPRLAAAPAIPDPAPVPAERPREIDPSLYFIRQGEEMRPIDLDRVVCIRGADDYTEVTTLNGTHLVRMTLAEFEQTLDPARFARVHRSWIVNLHRVDRVEPAGGRRLLLHMATGHAVPASRSGARSVRDRVL
jgi:two-component system, LytTR family, response regulator